MSERFFIGIDPSVSSTGLVVLADDGSTELATRVRSASNNDGWRGAVRRYNELIRQIRVHLAIYQNTEHYILVEDYAPHHIGSAIPSIEFGASLRTFLWTWESLTKGCAYFTSPGELKKFVTGKGNADKVQVAAHLSKRYGVLFDSDDIYDAYGLARMVYVHSGDSNGATVDQIRLAEKIR